MSAQPPVSPDTLRPEYESQAEMRLAALRPLVEAVAKALPLLEQAKDAIPMMRLGDTHFEAVPGYAKAITPLR